MALTDTTVILGANNGTPLYGEPFRPQYHFTPPRNWINDPNGLVFWQGEYHLFYQYNPFGDKWGHMSWGHAISPDLVRWGHLPVAIPELETSQTMIFSGSAVVDHRNTSGLGERGIAPMVAIYTAHRTDNQSQALAYSLDNGRTWTQYAGNPVLDIGKKDFRDPKVFWHTETGKWIMAVSLPVERKVSFYASGDLKSWTHLSDFGPAGDTADIWECPDLFELPVQGEQGSSRWVLLGSVPKRMQYFIGRFDGKTFVNENAPDLVLRPDYGPDYFAAITYNNAPSTTERISIGWMNNWNYANEVPTSPWRGAMSLPRELTLRRTPDGIRMMQAPLSALSNLRAAHTSLNGKNVTSTTLVPMRGQNLEVRLTIDPGKASRFGVKVATSADKETDIRYDVPGKTLTLDRTRSGATDFSKDFPTSYTAPCALVNGVLALHIFVDSSSVEVFANGQTAITALIFPNAESMGVELYTLDEPVHVNSGDAWKLDSIWPSTR